MTAAPRDPKLPGHWTVREYVETGARLQGTPRALVGPRSDEAMKRLGVHTFATQKLAKAPKGLRRGVVLAAALATDPRCIVMEDPTFDLADDERSYIAEVLERALAGREWVMFTPSLSPSSPFARLADRLYVMHGSAVVAKGSANELAARGSGFALRFDGDSQRFEEDLRAVGIVPLTLDRANTFYVTLPEGTGTRAFFAAAASSGARILELSAMGPAFS